MYSKTMPVDNMPINHAILKWAREDAGLTLVEAATRAHISSPRPKKGAARISPAERLAAWESGDEIPSFPQLKSIAAAYYRPVLTFFLPRPPKAKMSLTDFRTLGSRPNVVETLQFAAFKRRLEALQEDLIDLAHINQQSPLEFVGSTATSSDPQKIALAIRHYLSFPFEEQQRIRDTNQFLRELRNHIQSVGIYVLFEGDLGSYHTQIGPEEFRGISFANEFAPIIVVNPNDSKNAQVFTLAHELAHIWRGSSGVSNLTAFDPSKVGEIEQHCNAVAAEFLVPKEIIKVRESRCDDVHLLIEESSKFFKVSHAVIVRRLLDIGRITRSEYNNIIAIYHSKNAGERAPIQNSGTPSRNRLDKFRLGNRLLSTVTDAAFEGKITFQNAARILRIPVSRFEKVLYA